MERGGGYWCYCILRKGGSMTELFGPFGFNQNQVNRVFQEILNPSEFKEKKKTTKDFVFPIQFVLQ